MRFYKKIVNESTRTDKEKVIEICQVIMKNCEDNKISFKSKDSEYVFDHHIVIMVERIIDDMQIDEKEYDDHEIESEVKDLTNKIMDNTEKECMVKINPFERFLTSTHIQVNRQGGVK